MKNSKIEMIEPNYEGIAKMIDSFRDLYAVGAPKELVDKLLEYHSMSNIIIKSDKGIKINIDSGYEITIEDIAHLVWIRDRLVNHYGEHSGERYIIKLDQITNKLRRNVK